VERMGIVLIVLGLALAATSGFADTIGLGDQRGFHYRQGIGVGVGVALAIAGVVIGVRRSGEAPDSPGPSPDADSTR
jgi:hypothetical protein